MLTLACAAPCSDSPRVSLQVAVAGLRPEFPAHVPRRLAAMAEACWAADPLARPTFNQVRNRYNEKASDQQLIHRLAGIPVRLS